MQGAALQVLIGYAAFVPGNVKESLCRMSTECAVATGSKVGGRVCRHGWRQSQQSDLVTSSYLRTNEGHLCVLLNTKRCVIAAEYVVNNAHQGSWNSDGNACASFETD